MTVDHITPKTITGRSFSAKDLENQIGELENQLSDLMAEFKDEVEKKKKEKTIWSKLKRVFCPTALSVLSFIFVLFFVVSFIFWKIFGWEMFSALFDDFSYNNGFFWVFISFIVLCNAFYFKNIIGALVEQKIDGEIWEQFRKRSVKTLEKFLREAEDMKREAERIDKA